MFIDIHVHVRRLCEIKRRDKQAYSMPEQLIERFDSVGIERGVLLPGVNPECAHVPQSMQEVLDICRDYPGRFIPFCNVDPRSMTNSADAPLNELLSYWQSKGCKGIGEVCANLPFEDPRVQNLFTHAEALRMPLTFHIAPKIGGCYGLYDEPGLPQLERSLESFPKLIFLGHSQPFWAEVGTLRKPEDRCGYPDYPIDAEGAVPKLMRRHPNLYGDLSAGSGCNALRRDPAYAVRFLNEFQDRLLFGTDIVAPDTATPLVDFLLDLRKTGKISEPVFQKVARENAIALLGL